MAINDILNQILTSVYGRDVRQAIHDGIQECYATVNTASEAASLFLSNFAGEFDSDQAYSEGQYVTRESTGRLYRFITDHPVGSWNSAHVRYAYVGDELSSIYESLGEQGIGRKVNGYLNSEGNIVVSSEITSMITDKVKCSEGDVFIYTGRSINNAVSWIQYNGSTIVRTKNYGQTVNDAIVIIPQGITHIRFAGMVYANQFPFRIEKRATNETTYGYIKTYRATGFLLNTEGAEHYSMNVGDIYFNQDYNCVYTEKIPCTRNDVFLYTGRSMTYAAAAILYSGSTIMSTITASGNEYRKQITIPEGIDYVRFASFCGMEYGLSNISIEEPGYGPLFKKKINFLGDSYIKNANDSEYETWAYKIAKKYNMTYRGYGINGNGMVSGSNPMSSRYTSMDNDADYVIVVGGTNDFNNQVSITTFKSSLETLITGNGTSSNPGLVGKYPNSKIAFFTIWNSLEIVNPVNSSTKTYEKKEYNDAIIEVCEKYGIPVFDSWRKSGICPWDAATRTAYFQASNDYSHLNRAGHDRFLPVADAFLNSI